jgi:hypothetical protein
MNKDRNQSLNRTYMLEAGKIGEFLAHDNGKLIQNPDY